ncbi:MAG: YjbQ family protein [Acidobacteria bacterium]|nr:YjbQ family protein [Acidobacteriota bacterium]
MLLRREVRTSGKGVVEITSMVAEAVDESGIKEGLCTIFVRHTSASLVIQENADPGAVRDLEAWFERAVPENDPLYTHTQEGPDDMPAHIKSALTASSLAVPVDGGRLALGTWQGIFLWEHRSTPKRRQLVIYLQG